MSRIVPPITSKICLTEGDSVVVGSQVAGASATTWTVPAPATGGAGRDVVFTTDTVTSMTTLTADLECSSDAGTTWNKFKTTMALIATSVGAAVVATNLPCALIYRVNVTTESGTSCSVLATVS